MAPGFPVFAESKVFLLNGETRVGFVHARDARITIRGADRLFQVPEDAVHRIDHVTGETALVGSEDVLLREKPERLSKNLVAIPKGCEVKVLERAEDWAKVEVYGGRTKAEGYLHVDDLSDSVFFHNIDPRIRFKPPPPTLANRFDIGRNYEKTPERVSDLIDLENETGFNNLLLDRLYGGNIDSLLKQAEELKAGEERGSRIDEEAKETAPSEPEKTDGE